MSYKIMIIEDDKNIAKLLGEHIEKYGYEALVAKDFEKILETFEMEKPNLILLDVNLPKFDGYYWCRRIREKSLCPIIFISARDSEMNQVMAIESGADDYITKPFYYEVVLAKIKSQLRRVYGDYAANSQVERILDVEGLLFYPERLQVHFNEKEAMLSKKEGDLLDAMMKIYPKVATREELLEKIWDDTTFVDENTLNVNIARLRKKLSDLGIKDSIETVRGAGYRLNVTWRK
ncbi:response regulator transcription factor [Clostridium botulinum]|uniref:response regulator transcription factor n=1 Tax=Clostridium botulinum TaxID=1491 RepID=UPI0007736B9A|nr:response regulator transcription factor [Clostridium botulinum]APQ96359.1 response regulator [Clostridium botulinum]KEI75561.1 transcriptional regulator [Clostridium botulinum B2 128]KEI89281.1 transcriptional regulator [Clostridium botulinum B2 433]MBN3362856.1 DNA-binding response regulator [Clostridium botulinum]MBY6950790.1 response regulator transcription factor [Clostridium botulinum]